MEIDNTEENKQTNNFINLTRQMEHLEKCYKNENTKEHENMKTIFLETLQLTQQKQLFLGGGSKI